MMLAGLQYEMVKKYFGYEEIFKDKKKVMVAMAHPDDADVFWGGLIKRLTGDNKEVLVLVSVNGARGSKINNIGEDELANLRKIEEINALTGLGVKKENIRFLDFLDGELDNNYVTIGKFTAVIREFQPDIICTHDPSYVYVIFEKANGFINHRDHRKTGECISDAVYPFCRDVSFYPEQIKDGLKPAYPMELLYTTGNSKNTQIYINNEIEDKIKALKMHKSQFGDEEAEGIKEIWKDEGGYFEEANWLRLEW